MFFNFNNAVFCRQLDKKWCLGCNLLAVFDIYIARDLFFQISPKIGLAGAEGLME